MKLHYHPISTTSRPVMLFAAESRFEAATLTKDLAGLARVVKARRR